METSYFLAQLFGGTMFTIGLALLLNPKYYLKVFKSLMKNEDLIFLSGFMALPAGLALIIHHNVWDGPWWVIAITILCWAILIKGIFLFIAPEWMQDIGKSWMKKKALFPWIGALYTAMGVLLGYYGFFY